MDTEKQARWIKAPVRGLAGQGSLPARGGAVTKFAKHLQKLDKKRLPVHIKPAAQLMFKTMASTLGRRTGLIVDQLKRPALTNIVLNLLGTGVMFWTHCCITP